MTLNLSELRESMAVAEQLAKQSIGRRQHPSAILGGDDGTGGYIPPKQLLMYIVRMGSFTSAPKIVNADSEDDAVVFPEEVTSSEQMELHCRRQLAQAGLPPLLTRTQTKYNPEADRLDSGIRVMQWNTLSQTLGVHNDNFTECPPEALEWDTRRYRLLEEICCYDADIVCMQEVDHFNFFKTALGKIGYDGVFFPKPDSPCIYIKSNNGPDGCALFFRTEKFELLETHTRVIEVWKVQSNQCTPEPPAAQEPLVQVSDRALPQVVILCVLRDRNTGRELCAVSTHLKARSGALLSAIRSEQGKDLLAFISGHSGGRPVLLCGDFNAEPSEPVYSILTEDHDGNPSDFQSAYRQAEGCEPEYTTWKIRGSGEVRQTLDYVFLSRDRFQVDAVLPPPSEDQLGVGRAPCLSYPSDHFSLVTDVRLLAD